MKKKEDSRYEKCVDCKNEWNVAKHLEISDKYICPHCQRMRNDEKAKKLNFWDMLPKITQTFMACMSVYVMHREYDKTDTISGLSFVLPMMILVYFIIAQVLDMREERSNK